MNFFAEVTKGKKIGPQIHVITGDNGIGKSTWAAGFPNVLMADLESGSNHLDVERIEAEKLPNLAAFRALIQQLLNGEHNYKTFVVDSIESLEALICDAICVEGKVDSIEKYEGGWGKGFTRSREIMREIMMDLQVLRSKGVTSILVGHTQVKSKTDPATNQTWDRIVMRCNDKMGAVVRDLADNVFYCTHKVFTTKDGNKTKAYNDGQRVMYTQWRSGFDAKNRLELPLELPLSYDAFTEACNQKPEADVGQIVEDIKAISSKLDESLKADVVTMLEKFKNNPEKLKEFKNRLMKYTAA